MTDHKADSNIEPSLQSAGLFNLLVENVKEYAVFMTDAGGRVISWNPGIERLLGFTENEIVGQPLSIIFTPEDIAAGIPAKEIERAAQAGRSDDKRWHRRKDGSLFWADGMVLALTNTDGALHGFAKIMRDDTAQKQAEENLKYQKTLLEALTESLLDGILIVSTEGKMQHFNQKFLGIWNFPAEILKSKSDKRALEWAANQTVNPEAFLARVNSVYENPDQEVREELPLKDGRVFELFGAPILSGGNRLGWVWSFRDITERKHAERNLEFLTEISQDLNKFSGAREIMQTMTDKIGKYLGVSNCVFAEVDTAANKAVINYGWMSDDTAVDLVGNYKLSEFVSDDFCRTLTAGKPVVVNDVGTDPRTSENSANLLTLKIRSFVSTPYVSGGILKFVLGVYRSEAYEWRADEIVLLGELMLRIWTRIERARAEDSLRESEESYRVLAEAASDAIIRIDENNTIQYVNTSAEFIFGYSAEEMLGQSVVMIMPEEMRRQHTAGMHSYLKTGKRKLDWRGLEIQARHKDGHYFPLEISFGEYKRGGKRFFTSIARDITNRKAAETAVRESEEKFRDLANSISQLAWMADASGSIFWYNERWFDYTGTTSEEMLGWGWRSVQHPDEVERVTEKFKSHVSSGEIWEDTFPLRSRTGEFRWFLSRAAPIRGEQGEIKRWFGTNTDIEELRQARAQAEQANRLKDEFLATVSHELRTPLNAILGWSQMLRQTQKFDESTAKTALATIERNALAQNQLIDDLLDVSRIITGKLRLNTRTVDLSAVISAAIEASRPAAEAKNIRLQALFDPRAEQISGDPDRLQQIIWNLISNAVKFTPKGGRVQVRLERVDSHVEIIVSDTGVGIEPAFLPQVFDRFRQADQTTTRRQGGLGLGLAIVRQLVDLHGGQVSVLSAGQGLGAVFTVSLPFLPVRIEPERNESQLHRAAQIGAAPDTLPDFDGLRLLVVDDQQDARDLLEAILTGCGAQVIVASSVVEAIKLLEREETFDLLITDIGMPDEDGYSLIQKVRLLPPERSGKMPAVALTAYARAEDRLRALRSGFQMHIAKPVEPVELIAVVANLTGR